MAYGWEPSGAGRDGGGGADNVEPGSSALSELGSGESWVLAMSGGACEAPDGVVDAEHQEVEETWETNHSTLLIASLNQAQAAGPAAMGRVSETVTVSEPGSLASTSSACPMLRARGKSRPLAARTRQTMELLGYTSRNAPSTQRIRCGIISFRSHKSTSLSDEARRH